MEEALSFQSCKTNPDIWLRPATMPDWTSYYQYVLLYMYDILAIMEDPELFLREEMNKLCTLKDSSISS
eukprot:10261085-Ditylum_brightwellii.AAC.1